MNIRSMPYKVDLKEAKPYMSMMELDEHPHTVLAKTLASTSSAAPQHTQEPEAAVCEDSSSCSEATNICPPSASESGSESSSPNSPERHGVTNVMFFKATTFTSDRLKWLCAFYNYLTLPDAGYKKQAQRLQQASQVKLLLEALAPNEDDLDSLGVDNGLEKVGLPTPAG